MSVKINRLKIRMPAGSSARPEVFARQVAEGLAQRSGGLARLQADHLYLRLPSRKGDMTGAVINALGRALRGNGQS